MGGDGGTNFVLPITKSGQELTASNLTLIILKLLITKQGCELEDWREIKRILCLISQEKLGLFKQSRGIKNL